MTRFIAELNGEDHINIPADRMELDRERNCLIVYRGHDMVALVDTASIITAHISERSGPKCRS